jgi:hypothetical protein
MGRDAKQRGALMQASAMLLQGQKNLDGRAASLRDSNAGATSRRDRRPQEPRSLFAAACQRLYSDAGGFLLPRK